MQLCPNQKIFVPFFYPFSKSKKNWECFEKKDEPQRLFRSEIIDCKKESYLNAQKAPCPEHLWTVNILKGPKYCLTLHSSIVLILFDNSEKKISCRNSVLVLSEILRFFVNKLTPDDRHSLSVKARSNATNSNAIIAKSKNIFSSFFCIFRIYKKFRILWKKILASDVTFSEIRDCKKRELLKCRKSLLSENSSTVNMLKDRKDCRNLQCSIFVIFFDPSERKSARKILY